MKITFSVSVGNPQMISVAMVTSGTLWGLTVEVRCVVTSDSWTELSIKKECLCLFWVFFPSNNNNNNNKINNNETLVKREPPAQNQSLARCTDGQIFRWTQNICGISNPLTYYHHVLLSTR